MNLEVSKSIREELNKLSKSIEEEEVGLLLSGGLDSRCILYSLLECGKKVHCYVFHMDDRESTDLKLARKISSMYNLELTEVSVPSDVDSLKSYLLKVINKYGATHKADIECIYPLWYVLPSVKEKVIFSGVDCGIFLDSKKAILHYTETLELSREWRLSHYSNRTQINIIDKIIKDVNPSLRMIRPYYEEDIFNLFLNLSYEEVNKPKSKQIMLDVFPEEIEKFNSVYQANYQKGDSGIADTFEKLMDTDWSRGKSVTSIYNAIIRKEIPKKFVFGSL